jgi:hypothetical protein
LVNSFVRFVMISKTVFVLMIPLLILGEGKNVVRRSRVRLNVRLRLWV